MSSRLAVAQIRAAGVLCLALEVPALGSVTRLMTRKPQVDRSAVVEGVPVTVARPGAGSCWPAVVLLNGVTARGRFHPAVERLALALARVGFLVLVPDLPGLAGGEVTEHTLAAATGVVQAAAGRRDVRDGRVGLVGVSVGISVGLLAAEQPDLADRITVVAGIAPYLDLANTVRLATTGHLLEQGRLVPHPIQPFMSLVVARSLIASLPPSTERDELLSELRGLADGDPRPLALFGQLARARLNGARLDWTQLNWTQLNPGTRAVVELLANESPSRFDVLYAALPASLRASVERLSPLAGADRLRAPVEIASAPDDKYLPLSEARSLALAAGQAPVRLTVTSTLEHAIPTLSLSDLAAVARLNGWAVRVLSALR